MHSDLVLIVALFSLVVNAAGKTCPSMDIRSNAKSLEKLRNCTIVMGSLQVVLIDTVNDSSVYDQYSFPELTEIVDYLLMFEITDLTSLGKLFPNLRVIRGRKLFVGYALVLYRLPHLQEIGLTNLQRIGRGAVKVDYCPKVCYVKTVNWEGLGATKLDFPSEKDSYCKDQFCPNECTGYCWNNYNCQKRNITFCDDFEDNGKCVAKCPSSKVINLETMKCLTKAECESTLNGTWWTFNGTCVNSCPIFYDRDETIEGGCRFVGKNYTKHCRGNFVNALDALEEFKGCTHVDGPLEISMSNFDLEPHLKESLGNIISISGYLKIGRSKTLSSLEFLENLSIIKGEILDNNKYSLFIFENESLRKLWNFDNNFKLTISAGTMAFHDNPQLCLSEIEKLEKTKGVHSKVDKQISRYSNGYRSFCNQKNITVNIVEKNSNSITLAWQGSPSNDTIIGYTIYYKVAPENAPVTNDKEDTCGAISWESIFVRENEVVLKNLSSYTRYAFYIKTYITAHQGEQTPIDYFITASSEPSKPIDFTAEAISDNSILLKWQPPTSPNGRITHYDVTTFLEEDYLPIINQRNYCEFPHITLIKEEPTVHTYTPLNNSKYEKCSCLDKPNELATKPEWECLDKMEACLKNTHQEPFIFPRSLDSGHTVRVYSNETQVEFKGLKHYTMYIFYLSACNTDDYQNLCGPSVMTSQRTNAKKKADMIRNLRVKVDKKNAYVRWSQPEESNSVIVAYQVEYRKSDSEHSKPRFECITEEQYLDFGLVHKIPNLLPGKYDIRVQAISLAGPGVFSDWKHFEISSDADKVLIISLTTIGSCVAILLAVACVYYRRKTVKKDLLITSINPDYAGPIYVEDKWEIDRNDIEIIKELGQGSFGMVYQGLIKSRNYPCAIKTVNEAISMTSKMEFLNEGSVMKTFSDAHHVVKLLGIVSRGQPPYVIMELMEGGDLKSYLRRCRKPSCNLTTNEIYRMAAEIADGMAYLAAKKFVHRDLAARNCMVAADRTVKIGDFGMARDIYETDYYRKETVGLLPVRWMAPESLADGVFTSDSDVWSYGIVLWEMATLAEQPYQGLSNEEVFHFVKNRGRLERPNECSDFLYEIMDACWMWRPNDRPTFSDIVNRLVDHVGEDFRLVAFCFSRQGMELALNAGPRVYNPPAMTAAPEDDYFSHFNASEEEVNLYVKDPTTFLPYSDQRLDRSPPYQISPGSPSSTFSFNPP